MSSQASLVREFHEKYGQARDLPFNPTSVAAANALVTREHGAFVISAAKEIIRSLETMAEALESSFVATHDVRFLRMHLMLEELSEVCAGLMSGDEILLLDGIADLLYVVNGTAVTFGLPIDAAFEEVHASNMTKDVVRGNSEPRFRGKGESYRPPNLRAVLANASKEEAAS